MPAHTLQTSTGNSVTFLTQGALVQAFRVGGQNIVQTFPSADLYKTHNDAPYFSETIGRYANRIAGARIDDLNGRSYKLAANDGPNCLHGGAVGWGKKHFEGPEAVTRNGREALLFKYTSKDGDENFPGTVEARVWYSIDTVPGKGADSIALDAEYEVEMVGSEVEETVVATTNHCYFNVGSTPDLTGTVANYATNLYLPTDSTSIPTGVIEPFPNLPANAVIHFTGSYPVTDHCFIVNDKPSAVQLDTRSRPLKRCITLSHPSTNITLEVSTTEPAFQSYSGDGLGVPAVDGGEPSSTDQHGLDGKARGKRAGIAIEPSRYVDAVSRPDWRGQVLLKKGQIYGSKSRYAAWRS